MLHTPSSDKAAPTRLHNFWLLHATGQMMSHDSLADEIILQPFDAHHLPGLALFLEDPLSLHEDTTPLKGQLHKRISLPFPLPECEVVPSSHGLITLRTAEKNHHWLASLPDSNVLDFIASHSEESHSFLPLTLESYKGLARLMSQDQAVIRAVNQHIVGPAHFSAELPYHILIGDNEIALPHNLAELSRLGQLSSGQEDVITLQKDDDPALAYSFIIRISA